MKQGFILFSLLFIFVVAGYSSGQRESKKIMIIRDDLGHKLVLKTKPKRIISGAKFIDEIILSLAKKENILAITQFAANIYLSNNVEKAHNVKNHLSLKIETYIKLNPDLIILADWADPLKVRQLREKGIPVYQALFPKTLFQIKSLILTLGKIVEETEKANELIRWMDQKLEPLVDKLARIKPDDKLVVLDYNPKLGTAFGKTSMWNEIVQLAGLINAVYDYPENSYSTVALSEDSIIKLNPDIIILPGWVYNDPQGPAQIYQSFILNPLFRNLKALKNSRIYQLPEKFRYGGSHYFVLGVEKLAELAYPDLFNP